MMRLMKAFEQASEMRVTEYSLLFFLTIEMIVAGVGYYTMDTIGISTNLATEWFFIIWIVNLYIASLFIVALKPITFAVYRVVFRVIHIDMMLYIFWSTRQLVVSPYFIGFCILELAYLFFGVTKNAISYPGKWIMKFNDMWQGSDDTMNIENARESTFPIYDLGMDVKETTFDDEFTDDLYDYYTAFEDTVSPSAFSTKKHRGTFIV